MEEDKEYSPLAYAILAIVTGALAPVVGYVAYRVAETLDTAFMPIMAVAVVLGLIALFSFVEMVRAIIRASKLPK